MILTEEHAKAYGLMRLRMSGINIHKLINLHAGIKSVDGYSNALALLYLRMKNNKGDALRATLPNDWDKRNNPKRYYSFKRWNEALIRARVNKAKEN